MDKQLLSRVDSASGSFQEEEGGYDAATAKTKLYSARISTKCKVILVLVGVLVICAVAVVAVSIAQALQYRSRQADQHSVKRSGDPLIDSETKAELLKQVTAASREKRRTGHGGSSVTSCYSTAGNGSYAAARISGTGGGWMRHTNNNNPHLSRETWNTKWVCANESDAFVDGGMVFNQTDKKLYVPACGYYHISSQLYFLYDQPTAAPGNQNQDDSGYSPEFKYVSHAVTIYRNCGFENDKIVLLAYAALVTVNSTQPYAKTTAHISDVAKICRGGTIQVSVPRPDFDDHNPCCPIGNSKTTYLSAFLVAPTSCEQAKSSPQAIAVEDTK